MELFLFIGTIAIGIGGYRLTTHREDWWMYTYLPAVVMVVPFGLASAFSSIGALFSRSDGKHLSSNIESLLVTAAIAIVVFLIGAAGGYLQGRRRN